MLSLWIQPFLHHAPACSVSRGDCLPAHSWGHLDVPALRNTGCILFPPHSLQSCAWFCTFQYIHLKLFHPLASEYFVKCLLNSVNMKICTKMCVQGSVPPLPFQSMLKSFCQMSFTSWGSPNDYKTALWSFCAVLAHQPKGKRCFARQGLNF